MWSSSSVGGLRYASRALWLLAAFALLALALLVSFGRYYLPLVDEYREPLAQALSQRLGMQVRIGALEGQWQALGPVLRLRGLELLPDPARPPAVMLERAEVELDLPASLLALGPRLRELRLDGLAVALEQAADGRWQLQGRRASGPLPAPELLLEALGRVSHARLGRASIQLAPLGREPRALQLSGTELDTRLGLSRLRAEALVPGSRQPVQLRARIDHGASPELQLHLAFSGLDVNGLDWSARAVEGRDISGGLWLNWSREAAASVQLQLDAGEIAWMRGEQRQLWQSPRLQARLDGLGLPQWQLSAALSPGRLLAVKWPDVRLQLSADGDRRRLWVDHLQAPVLNATLLQSGLLSENLSGMLRDMNLQGALHDAWLEWPAAAPREFSLQARLDRVGLSPHRHIPGGSGISGYLQADAGGGRVELQAQDFSMAFPGVYREPLAFARASGTVSWQLYPQHAVIRSGVLLLEGEDGHARGLLRLSLPYRHEAGPSAMELAIGLSDSDANRRNKFIPYILSPHLLEWLDQSIRKGAVRSSGFWYRGGLEKGAPRTVQLFFDVAGGELRYHPEWPAITDMDGLVVIDEGRVQVQPDRAAVLGSRLEQARVEVTPLPTGVAIDVQSQLHGDAGDILRLLNESPLRQHTGAALAEWQASGPYSGRVDLHLPLTGSPVSLGRDARVEVEAQLANARLDMAPLRLPVEQLSGVFRFDLTRGLSAPALTGQLWGRPLQASLATQRGELRLDGSARVRGADAVRWLGLVDGGRIQGESDYRVSVRLPGADRRSVQVESSLAGTALDLPAPFGKPREEKRPLAVNLEGPSSAQQLRVAHGDIRAELRLRDLRPESGTVTLGGQPVEAQPGMIRVGGRLARFSPGEWQTLFGLANGAPAAAGVPPADDWRRNLRVHQLAIGQIELGSFSIPEARIGARREDDGWRVELASEPVAGLLQLPDAAGAPMRLALDYLQLDPPPPPPPPAGVVPDDPWRALDPASLPALDAAVKRVRRGELDYGSWQLSLRPVPGGVRIGGLQGSIRGVSVAGIGGEGQAQLEWLRSPEGVHSSHLRARLATDNLGDVLQAWQYGRSIESKRAQLDLDTRWPASPAGQRLAIMHGDIGIDFRKGSFVNISGRTDALRIMGLMNFDAVVRRLRLDFSDLYRQGLVFDEVRGRLRLQGGTARFEPPLEIACPSSNFRLSASLDLQAETIDGDMQVTLPLSGNLPWVAGLVGGLPVAAGVFIASKLLEEQVDAITRAAYRVTGPWADPKVEFQRAIDVAPRNKPETPAAGQKTPAADAGKEKRDDPPSGQPADGQRPGAPGQP